MNNKQLITSFGGLAFLALFGLALLFQTTTPNARVTGTRFDVTEYEPDGSERLLAREPCLYIEAVTELDKENCVRLGQEQCNRAYGVPSNPKGDVYQYEVRDCLRQCIRDANAQCEYASTAFPRPWRR